MKAKREKSFTASIRATVQKKLVADSQSQANEILRAMLGRSPIVLGAHTPAKLKLG